MSRIFWKSKAEFRPFVPSRGERTGFPDCNTFGAEVFGCNALQAACKGKVYVHERHARHLAHGRWDAEPSRAATRRRRAHASNRPWKPNALGTRGRRQSRVVSGHRAIGVFAVLGPVTRLPFRYARDESYVRKTRRNERPVEGQTIGPSLGLFLGPGPQRYEATLTRTDELRPPWPEIIHATAYG
jgi:hypothetical protein